MNRKSIWIVIVVAIALVLILLMKTNNPLKNNEVKILTPSNGEEIEIGDNYTVTWSGKSTYDTIALVEKIYTSDDQFSYGYIAKDIPFSSKSFTWKVPFRPNQYKYKIALLTKNKTEIAVSDGFFVPVDNNLDIAGSTEIVIDPNHLFSFGDPFIINPSLVYSSSNKIQRDFASVTANKFYIDACGETAFYPTDIASNCTVKGEQAIEIEMTIVHGSEGIYSISIRNVHLSTITYYKIWDKETGYEVELLSLDAQKKEAKIVVRKK
jgi:hypothetical protein